MIASDVHGRVFVRDAEGLLAAELYKPHGSRAVLLALEPGDYAIRGGIVDIFPPGQEGPVRLDLFGDVLDGARRFDPGSQRTTETLDVVELAP